MNWIQFIWYAMAGSCLTLCGVYLIVWRRRASEFEYLALVLASAAVSAMAVIELMVLQATSFVEFDRLVRWFHVPTVVLLASLLVFVRLRYKAGSWWLGGAAIVMRLASLVANFLTGASLNFTEVTSLTPLQIAGATVMVPHGTANPWMALGTLSLILFVSFLVHAVWVITHRAPSPSRWQDSSILIAAAIFLMLSGTWAALVVTSTIDAPFMVVPPFAAVVLALGYDLGVQLLRANELSRKLADSEAGRQAGELHLELLGRARGFGGWSWNCQDGTVMGSPRALELLDIRPGQVFDPYLLAERISEEHRSSLADDYIAALTGNGEVHNEFCVTLRDGGVRWLAAVGHVERNPAGEPLAVQGILLDVSNRREADERFRRVVEAAPTAMLLVRLDGSIVFANERAEQVFGYARKELYGMSIDDLVPKSKRGAHAALRAGYARDAISRDMAATREVFGLHKDGREFAVEINISAMPSESGMQFLAIVNDVSARKQAEKEAGLRRNELAHLSRVVLLAELSGSLAHELNQPLTAILSNAQAGARFLAHDPPDLDEVRESFVNIVESDKRAGEVIRRLRAMLRKDPPDFQRLDLNEVVADVLHIVHSDLISRNVEIELLLDSQLPATMGDRIQLQQVLLNLIMNACDAMSSCAWRSLLTIRTRGLEGNSISVDVGDSGLGIPEQDLERIFAPFVSSKNGGMGLGLAICATIVQTHNGRLWAENNPGAGATLHIELPAIEESGTV